MVVQSTTHFIDSESTYLNGKPQAIIYRRHEDYPRSTGRDLISFLKECKALPDSRLNDAAYLAARYVVFLANMFNGRYGVADGTYKFVPNESRIDFISVGVVNEDPVGIQYRYIVDCGKIGKNGLPEVKCFEVREVNGKVEPIKRVKVFRKNGWA